MAKRILVPLDDRAGAEAVLRLAAELARAGGATVRLLHVTTYYPTRYSDDNRVVFYAHQQEERDAAEAATWLRTLEPDLDGAPVEHAVRIGDPGEEILREAEAFGADAIVLRAARRPWWRHPLGRVARQVRAGSSVPVLLLSEAA